MLVSSSIFRSTTGLVARSVSDGLLTLGALGDGQQDACNERLAVVGLLEDGDLLSETGPGPTEKRSAPRWCARAWDASTEGNDEAARQLGKLARRGAAGAGSGGVVTYVPGFWSVKGVSSTVLTSILVVLAASRVLRRFSRREELAFGNRAWVREGGL